MCQTGVISKKIINIGTRTYRNHLESMGSNNITPRKLSVLNRDLDNLNDLLYQQFPTITAKDYNIFGPQLRQLLKTLKDLYITCKRFPDSYGLKAETEKLGFNYSAISELESDICNYKVKSSDRAELSLLLKDASKILASI